MVWVKYIIPEDGDEHTHPNIYQFQENGEVLVSDIVQSFPVPGKYHFRFLKTVSNFTVWLDSPNANTPAPTFQGSIFVKASRIATSSSTASTSNGHATVNFMSEAPSANPSSKSNLLNINEEPIFDSAPAASFGNDDLLGLSGNAASTAKSAAADPFGFDTLQPATLTPTSSATNNTSINTNNNNSASSRVNTSSPMMGGSGSMKGNPMQQPISQAFNPMGGGGGMNPMSGGMNTMGGGMNSMNRGPMGGAPMGGAMGGGAPRGVVGGGGSADPFGSLNSGFGGNSQSQYNRGGNNPPKRNY